MFLIVGLGNPGAQYAKTRHNIGWMVLDQIVRRYDFAWQKKNADTKIGLGLIFEQKVALLKPQTFMNLSGRPVQALKNYYRLDNSRILIVTDDLNLSTGKLRLRPSGSDGGHNGLKSVAQMLGTTDYPRLRFGVGQPPSQEREQSGTAAYVLRPFEIDEWPLVEETISRAADAIENWIRNGVSDTMARFNG